MGKTGLDKKSVAGLVDGFVQLATAEVKKTGKFTIPGLCMLKTKVRPARKAGTSMAFGKQIKVKDRQGVLRESSERQHLKMMNVLLICSGPRSSTSECFSLAAAQDVGLSTSFERCSL